MTRIHQKIEPDKNASGSHEGIKPEVGTGGPDSMSHKHQTELVHDLDAREYFDEWTEEYTPEVAVQSSDEKRYALLREISSCDGFVLDVGCGDREPLFVCNQKNGVAFDFSVKALKNLREKGFKGHLVLGSVSNLPFKKGAFQSAICSEVIEHFPTSRHVKDCIKELARVSACFVITTPDKDSLHGWKDEHHPVLLNSEELRALFDDLPVEITTIAATYPIQHWDSQRVTRLFYKFQKKLPGFVKHVYRKLWLSKVVPMSQCLQGACIIAVCDAKKINIHVP